MIEKVISYLKGFILMSALVLIPAACSQGTGDEPEPVIPENPNDVPDVVESDSVLVSFAPQSLEWEVSPMSRASNDDLYAVIGYQSSEELPHEPGATNRKATQTILALFDDPSLISLKLAKSQYYHFVMTYVPNGKNVIEKIGDRWGAPFSVIIPGYESNTPALNTVNQKTCDYWGFCESDSHPAGEKGTSFINDVLRYMGTCRNFKPENNNQKIEIKLYRWQYGIKITATDFTEGTVIFRCNQSSSLKLEMQSNPSGVSTMQHYLQFPLKVEGPNMTDCEDLLEFADYPIADKMEIVYITPAGEEIMLWTSGFYNFPFKRMKMYTLEFSLSDAIANGGISPDLMEAATDPMEEISWNL